MPAAFPDVNFALFTVTSHSKWQGASVAGLHPFKKRSAWARAPFALTKKKGRIQATQVGILCCLHGPCGPYPATSRDGNDINDLYRYARRQLTALFQAREQLPTHHLCPVVCFVRRPSRRHFRPAAGHTTDDAKPHPIASTEPAHVPLKPRDPLRAFVALGDLWQVSRELSHFHRQQPSDRPYGPLLATSSWV